MKKGLLKINEIQIPYLAHQRLIDGEMAVCFFDNLFDMCLYDIDNGEIVDLVEIKKVDLSCVISTKVMYSKTIQPIHKDIIHLSTLAGWSNVNNFAKWIKKEKKGICLAHTFVPVNIPKNTPFGKTYRNKYE